ncbi:hypothetical protein [Pseudophaeobacter profundi]|nr:hypothetical protein [Pseudophaeobacter profundi]
MNDLSARQAPQETGALCPHLPPEEDTILAWCRRAIAPDMTQTEEL